MPELGSQPIQDEYREQMNKLAAFLDGAFNPTGEKKNGFILMVFPLDANEGRCNYISNAHRPDVITMLKEQVKYFEGQPENLEGSA